MSFDISAGLITGTDYDDWRPQPSTALQQQSLAAIAQIVAFYTTKNSNPLTSTFLTKDGRVVSFVILQPDRYWAKFCRAVGREDLLSNHKYATMEGRADDVAQLRQIFSQAFLTKTLEEWRPLLDGIPYAPNQTLKDVIKDQQAIESGCFVSYDHPNRGTIRQLANPVVMSRDPASVRMPAPEFGQHTEEVLLEYGYTWDDIARLKDEGAIA
jgi:crotonobetainyl-CoA:carnitine CoA-transferase CaiB-like acyl-CoA transferase